MLVLLTTQMAPAQEAAHRAQQRPDAEQRPLHCEACVHEGKPHVERQVVVSQGVLVHILAVALQLIQPVTFLPVVLGFRDQRKVVFSKVTFCWPVCWARLLSMIFGLTFIQRVRKGFDFLGC